MQKSEYMELKTWNLNIIMIIEIHMYIVKNRKNHIYFKLFVLEENATQLGI